MPFGSEFAQCQSCKRGFFRNPGEQWKRLCWNCFSESKRKTEQQTKGPAQTYQSQTLDQEMLRRLIYLCHPDKHNSSEASMIATQWLLKQRKP